MSAVTQDKAYQKPVMFTKTVTSDRCDTYGYAEIYSAGTLPYVGATAAGLAAHADYAIDITVDGTLRKVRSLNFSGSTTWTQIAAAIQAALRVLTSRSEDVTITNYKLKATSNKATGPGTGTSVVFPGGTPDSGTDLRAAIAAVAGGLYTATIATPVPGRDGVVYFQVSPVAPTTKDFFFVANCVTSAYKQKFGLKYSFSKTTGIVSVADDADVIELANGDIITIAGVFA